MSSHTLLVVAAHPDDEVLGCGATVALRVSQGWQAHLLIMTAGVSGRYRNPSGHRREISSQLAALKKNMEMAAEVLGFTTWEVLDFPDNRMDTVSRMDLAHSIDKVINRLEPEVLFTHHPGDYNWDHTVTFDAVMMAARQSPGEYAPCEILSFEVPSSTERSRQHPLTAFHPNVFVDVADTIDKKKLALKYYTQEYNPYPHPRSIEGIEYLSRKRGLEVGLFYAEAFELIRKIDR